ncbi:hypothetical protein [Sphingorhabdus sp. M41]|uniref:hypothetical protein n=1 Tax=Sphingorhabdus sp. M41 TaxID=1806885 RepID=UPI00078C2CCA|nr:hypothetical protein [Sphingorhabdus sp. M41]AMO72328.1 hypothetical protein AZE99_11115 [Sphingorhabdus sp. M41]
MTEDQNSNQSQRDDAQAQKFAEKAQQQTKAKREDVAQSRHGGEPDPAQIIPDDTQDTVDHMKQMVESGRIEGGAFAGERNDDDEESDLGILDEAEDDAPLSEKGGADFGNSG